MQVSVHVGRINRVQSAVGIGVLKNFLARQMMQLGDNGSQLFVFEVNRVFFAAFADKVEMQGRPGHVHMLVLQRGQAVMRVFFGVLRVADADQRRLQQSHNGCQYLLAGHSVTG